MQINNSTILLSATDLAFFMGCNHATWLDLQEAHGNLKAPPPYPDPSLEALKEKGRQFESDYIAELERKGKSVARITRDKLTAKEQTMRAMEEGADIIYQARLEHEQWNGWADFLIKTSMPGRFGNWSYEVEDTKFARHTKAGSILQICLYSYMLTHMQGTQPDVMHIRTPEGQQSYRVNEYIAYFRLMQGKLLKAITQTKETTYPHPVEQCNICRWWYLCNERRRKDDHLTFVAGMGSSQIREVKNWNVEKLKEMAEIPLPLPDPSKGNIQTYTKLREQARVQLQAREEKRNIHEFLPLQEDFGFYKLPEPSPGDIFFDFEHDAFVGNTGLEYLFGWVYKNEYHSLWARSDKEEMEAFVLFINTVMAIWKQYPDMHIYHFSPYEPAALKRLMGKYAIKQDEVDRLLRANVFVDLHTITRHSLRIGVESYSLKELERMHDFQRERDLKLVVRHKTLYESLLESDNIDEADEETIAIVRDYNKDDCLSTQSLRTWLEKLRTQLINEGNKIERPVLGEDEPSEKIKAFQERIKPIFDALMLDVPFDKTARSVQERARWLLAHMLDWYRREDKSFWWEYYRLRELDDDDLLNEKDALSGLTYTGNSEAFKKSTIHYYNFPEQETDLKPETDVDFEGSTIGRLISLDSKNLIAGIKKKNKALDIHPTHIIGSEHIKNDKKEEAIIRMAEWVIANGIDSDGMYRAGRDLLLRNLPRTSRKEEFPSNAQDKAVAWVSNLENSVLPIQGPPGTGKSHTAARMIVTLIKAGKKIGVTALSHKVITELLKKATTEASKEGLKITILQKVKEKRNTGNPYWIETADYNDISDAINKGGTNIIAGTSFMWSREQYFEAVDVLFVDEAGQLSLIDTLALSHAGKNLVLLGDPQQLQQPIQGHHPEGTEVSALAHILDEEETIHQERGVFLDKTWRMHPKICEPISELFYESRLEPVTENINQQLFGNTGFSIPGIYIESVQHAGNSNSSAEEVGRVKKIIDELLNNDVGYIDHKYGKHRLTADNIKIITPYNAQVNALSKVLPYIQVGTVDKFQGQEAQVIIYSMATSSPGDAPRGMEFLYSLHRLNVAVSRARSVFILVASPDLFEPDCRSPHQMKLANALCRLVEKSNNQY